jgi:hypothetical protein
MLFCRIEFGGVPLGIYFLNDLPDIEQAKEKFDCVYCNHSFEARGPLSVHYLEAHSSAFSAEELMMACSRHSHLT